MNDWVFAEPPNVAVFTLARIFKEDAPILFVSHDIEDGAWQFLDNQSATTADLWVVALSEIIKHDPSVIELAD